MDPGVGGTVRPETRDVSYSVPRIIQPFDPWPRTAGRLVTFRVLRAVVGCRSDVECFFASSPSVVLYAPFLPDVQAERFHSRIACTYHLRVHPFFANEEVSRA